MKTLDEATDEEKLAFLKKVLSSSSRGNEDVLTEFLLPQEAADLATQFMKVNAMGMRKAFLYLQYGAEPENESKTP